MPPLPSWRSMRYLSASPARRRSAMSVTGDPGEATVGYTGGRGTTSGRSFVARPPVLPTVRLRGRHRQPGGAESGGLLGGTGFAVFPASAAEGTIAGTVETSTFIVRQVPKGSMATILPAAPGSARTLTSDGGQRNVGWCGCRLESL